MFSKRKNIQKQVQKTCLNEREKYGMGATILRRQKIQNLPDAGFLFRVTTYEAR